MEKDHKREDILATKQGNMDLCQHPCRVCQALFTPQCTVSPCPRQLGDTGPWLMGWGDTDVLLRLWPCSLGSAPALALCLQDQGGLIKGGKATSRVSSAKHQLHVQGL